MIIFLLIDVGSGITIMNFLNTAAQGQHEPTRGVSVSIC